MVSGFPIAVSCMINSYIHAFTKLMWPKGVDKHLDERLARSRLPVSPLVSVILEEVPTVCVGEGIPSF